MVHDQSPDSEGSSSPGGVGDRLERVVKILVFGTDDDEEETFSSSNCENGSYKLKRE